MPEAITYGCDDTIETTAQATVAAGELHQLPDGRAGYYAGQRSAASGAKIAMQTEGIVTVLKTASIVFLDGGRVYWDTSAGKAHFKKVSDQDFYIGRAYGDAASADTTMNVILNVDPRYDVDILRDPHTTVHVGTQVIGGFQLTRRGGSLDALITATNEAQKCDALSVDSWAKGANAIVEGAFRVISDGAGTVVDVSMGLANATHASDADAITESAFIHLDANNTNINAESDDGTTEVNATDTTKDYVEGAEIANRVEFWIDTRDLTSVKFYVDGVRVLSGSTFKLDAATGPFKLLLHVEKSASTDTYQLALDWLRARFQE